MSRKAQEGLYVYVTKQLLSLTYTNKEKKLMKRLQRQWLACEVVIM